MVDFPLPPLTEGYPKNNLNKPFDHDETSQLPSRLSTAGGWEMDESWTCFDFHDRWNKSFRPSDWWFGTFFIFHSFSLFFHILGIITPTDYIMIFQRGRSNTNQP